MSGKSVAKKASAPKSRAAAASKEVVVGVLVSIGTAPGGFTIYGSPIKPKRITHEQIAAAVAKLD